MKVYVSNFKIYKVAFVNMSCNQYWEFHYKRLEV
jgi:hypothetical protein